MPRRGSAAPVVYSPQPEPRFAPNGYRLPDRIKEGEILTDINQEQWRLGRAIGVGGFGEIYLASDDVKRPVGADCQHVIKVEPHKNGPLFVEMNFYLRVAKPSMVAEWMKQRRIKRLGMPCYCGAGSHRYKGERYRFLVLPRFGTDLHKQFLKHGGRFHPRTALTLAIHILDILEYIHEHGYCHADIKDSNLLMGLTNNNDDGQVYLLDYGLASKYTYNDGRHKEYKCDLRRAHDGTIEYTSRDAHIGAHSRRGDMEILAYNLVHWISGCLPWEDLLSDPEAVAEMKQQCMSNIDQFLEICFGGSKPPDVLAWYLNYVAGMEFETKPDYTQCKQMMKAEIRRLGFTYSSSITFDPAPPLKKVKTSLNKKRKANGSPESPNDSPRKKLQCVRPAKEITPRSCNRMTRGSTPASSSFEDSFSWEKVLLSDPDKIGRIEAKKKKASEHSGRGRMSISPEDQTVMSPSTARQISLDAESLRNPTPAMLAQLASARRKNRPSSPTFATKGKTRSESSRCSSPVDTPTDLTPAMEDVLRRRLQFEADGKENRNGTNALAKRRQRSTSQPRRPPLKPTCRKQMAPVRHTSSSAGGVYAKKDGFAITKKYLRSVRSLRKHTHQV